MPDGVGLDFQARDEKVLPGGMQTSVGVIIVHRGGKMSKFITLRIPLAGAMLLVALLAITLSMAACGDDAQSVREANETAAVSATTADTPHAQRRSPSDRTEGRRLRQFHIARGDQHRVTVVIVPCSGDWQYRVLKSFQLPDAEAYPDESFLGSQVSENCDRQTTTYLFPVAEGWEGGRPDGQLSSAGTGVGYFPVA